MADGRLSSWVVSMITLSSRWESLSVHPNDRVLLWVCSEDSRVDVVEVSCGFSRGAMLNKFLVYLLFPRAIGG